MICGNTFNETEVRGILRDNGFDPDSAAGQAEMKRCWHAEQDFGDRMVYVERDDWDGEFSTPPTESEPE